DGEARDTRAFIGSEAALFHSAGIGLQGDLRLRGEAETLPHALQQSADALCLEEARRAAAEEHGLDLPALDTGQILVQVLEQGVHVGLLGQGALQAVGIEIAIRTFLHTPWDMYVKT